MPGYDSAIGPARITYRNANGFPPTLCIELLKFCNLLCPFCRSSSTATDQRRLEFGDVARLLEAIAEAGSWRIALTGGEPFFWSDIGRLLGLLERLSFPFSITTNGVATGPILERIPSSVWTHGTLYVSIDGNEAVHDRFRGVGNFRRTSDFLSRARQVVPRLFVGTVLVSNVDEWAEDLAVLLGRCSVDNWTLISPVTSGRWTRDLPDQPSAQPYDRYVATLRAAAAKHAPHTKVSFLDFAAADGKYLAAVYLGADGSVRLPGYVVGAADERQKPQARTISLSDANAPREIVNAVEAFVASEGFML